MTADDQRFETVLLESPGDPATVQLAYRSGLLGRRPVIMMPGSMDPGALPDWSSDVVAEGYILCAFRVEHPADPDPARRAVWLYFDQRFAHQYARMAVDAPADAARVIDYLNTRSDVMNNKIGWIGSSSTGIPGLAVATREPRLAAMLGLVSTGAYRQWFDTWHTNALWQGETHELWPETEALLVHDPILHVAGMYPTAVLLVSGGDDRVVDPATTEAFVAAARPHYAADPNRLRHVIYSGCGHNLPGDLVRMYANHWFRTYLHPVNDAPSTPAWMLTLEESVVATQVNASDHREIVGAG